MVQGHHNSFLLSASDPEERLDWINAIKMNVQKDPFFSIVQMRKTAATHKPLRDSLNTVEFDNDDDDDD